MHKLNLNPNSIYIGNWIYKKTTRVNSSQVFRAGRRLFLSIELNFWFGSHKDLEISGPSRRCEVDRSNIMSIDWTSINLFYQSFENRSIASRFEVGSTESQSIELLTVQIINRSKCLGRFSSFQDQPWTLEMTKLPLMYFQV
jgi:hypothetical protein